MNTKDTIEALRRAAQINENMAADYRKAGMVGAYHAEDDASSLRALADAMERGQRMWQSGVDEAVLYNDPSLLAQHITGLRPVLILPLDSDKEPTK
jgi:hypothetical protein